MTRPTPARQRALSAARPETIRAWHADVEAQKRAERARLEAELAMPTKRDGEDGE